MTDHSDFERDLTARLRYAAEPVVADGATQDRLIAIAAGGAPVARLLGMPVRYLWPLASAAAVLLLVAGAGALGAGTGRNRSADPTPALSLGGPSPSTTAPPTRPIPTTTVAKPPARTSKSTERPATSVAPSRTDSGGPTSTRPVNAPTTPPAGTVVTSPPAPTTSGRTSPPPAPPAGCAAEFAAGARAASLADFEARVVGAWLECTHPGPLDDDAVGIQVFADHTWRRLNRDRSGSLVRDGGGSWVAGQNTEPGVTNQGSFWIQFEWQGGLVLLLTDFDANGRMRLVNEGISQTVYVPTTVSG